MYACECRLVLPQGESGGLSLEAMKMQLPPLCYTRLSCTALASRLGTMLQTPWQNKALRLLLRLSILWCGYRDMYAACFKVTTKTWNVGQHAP